MLLKYQSKKTVLNLLFTAVLCMALPSRLITIVSCNQLILLCDAEETVGVIYSF